MIVNFNLSEKFKIPFISINAAKKTPSLEKMASSIKQMVNNQQIKAYRNGREKIIPLYQVSRFYTQDKYVVCEVQGEIYRVHKRIYELSKNLPAKNFVQISSAELVNMAEIANLALTKTGIYQVNLTNGETTYTSRRYVKKIREAFLK
ncbi:LytTR family DNA-binding domain-containing protein [Lactobacillus sp. ESL0791]|uniref:LytTR family DNA-binding domain-containing protein n=1 Tax=Lactobacillus sp. ESL0791 TaxID=2983234 RepID=UPI0023F65ABA|nr:LytTR family DNA-binding domain-containing protein [Lactobacillus sp. ESL0791]MDF7638088.1 LytTR family DNA-binding domain-containing protein [Lactobacillus sp. ESL0791]